MAVQHSTADRVVKPLAESVDTLRLGKGIQGRDHYKDLQPACCLLRKPVGAVAKPAGYLLA